MTPESRRYQMKVSIEMQRYTQSHIFCQLSSYISFRYFLPIIQLYIIPIFSANNPAIYHSHIICQLSSYISFPYYMPIIQLYIIPIFYANYPVIYHSHIICQLSSYISCCFNEDNDLDVSMT